MLPLDGALEVSESSKTYLRDTRVRRSTLGWTGQREIDPQKIKHQETIVSTSYPLRYTNQGSSSVPIVVQHA